MIVETKGVVIKQRNIGETDAIITILSDSMGVIEASAKGVKSARSKLQSSVQIFSYSQFSLFKGKSGYIINSADSVESFYNIRLDVVKLALASYLCEVSGFVAMGAENSVEALRLLLNSLYAICNDMYSLAFVKTIFEFKIMCISGYAPQMEECNICGKDSDNGRFIMSDGVFVCDECYVPESGAASAQVNQAVKKALNYIAESDCSKAFAIKIGDKTLEYLSQITEYYLIYHCERNFKSLEFYKNIAGNV